MYDENKIRESIRKKYEAREGANFEILDILKKYLEDHPHTRFGQALVALGIVQYHINTYDEEAITMDPFKEESIDMLNRIKR